MFNKSAALKMRQSIKGINVRVPVSNWAKRKYIYFDNAASTPALVPVLKEMDNFLDWYSGVHRGTGYKSLVSSGIYDHCHEVIGRFVGADLSSDTIVFVKNTTEAINKLSYRLQLNPSDIVIITAMEHHSNELPWRARAQIKYAEVDANGQLDLSHVESLFKRFQTRVKLLAVCGASNVTGHVNKVHDLAKMAHSFGSKIFVDGAQLVPHKGFNMKPHSHPEHIDFLAFSGHKIYSPFGLGVLIGPKKTFASSDPEYQGGGTVKLVMKDKIYWADPPDSDEAGSQNVVGAFALAKTICYLKGLGMADLMAHESDLTAYALSKLKSLDSIEVYGSTPRVGVISFNLKNLPHALVGAVLCHEAGIGLRTGCFCAQNYVRHLLGISENELNVQAYENKAMDKIPGMVRISLAPYNTHREVDHLCKWLDHINSDGNEFINKYRFSTVAGAYVPTFKFPRGYTSTVSNRLLRWDA